MNTSNLRIVCIVQNVAGNSGKGLSHTFNKINNDFLKEFLYEFKDRELSTVFGSDKQDKYLLITKNDVFPKPKLFEKDEWEILFICDSIALNEYPKFIFDENTLLMYHSTPQISDQVTITEISGKKIKKGKKGEHEPDEDRAGYARLLKLTEAWENGKFNKEKYDASKQYIIEWFDLNGKLNSALEFLHGCLGGFPASNDILKEGNSFSSEELNSIEKQISELKTKETKEYFGSLRGLRDTLLRDAGIE